MKKTKTTVKQKILMLLFSIIIILIIFKLGLGSFIILTVQHMQNIDNPSNENVYKILALGESTTAGGTYSWPAQLETILNSKSLNLGFRVYNEGVSGVNTAYISASLEKNIKKYNPDMVITMMGVNDDNNFIIYQRKEKSKFFRLIEESKIYRFIKSLLNYQKEEKISYNNENFKKNGSENEEDNYLKEARIYFENGKFIEARNKYNKVLEINPNSYEAYFSLGFIETSLGNRDKGIQSYENAIKVNPNNERAYIELGWIYSFEDNNETASYMFEKALKNNPNNHMAAFLLASVNKEKSERILQKYQDISVTSNENIKRLNYTKYHYRKTYEILQENNIKYIAMQYPRLNVQIIKDFFNEEQQKNVIFVSNKNNFDKALKEGTYETFFKDNFAGRFPDLPFSGDYGHTTIKGSSLIAENVAKVIIKELNITEK